MSKRAVLAVAALACALVASAAIAAPFPDGPGGPGIAIVNVSSLNAKAISGKLPAFRQYLQQVCEAWHCTGYLYLGQPNSPRDWTITLNDVSDAANAIGYHEQVAGVPHAYVSVGTAADAHVPWPVVFTHELAEMLVDPSASLLTQTAGDQVTPPQFYSFEVSDPVQASTYTVAGVRVADFVYRSWFTPDAVGPYDYMRVTRQPLQLTPGGWAAVFENGGWHMRTSPLPGHALLRM